MEGRRGKKNEAKERKGESKEKKREGWRRRRDKGGTKEKAKREGVIR